jgi:hypothetical protein
MGQAVRVTKAQLLEQRDQLLNRLANLQGAPAQGPIQAGEVDGMSIEDTINMALTSKRCVTWQAANKVVFDEGGFFPSRIPVIIEAFGSVLGGADALVVDSKGRHAAKVAEKHGVWLADHGFTKAPGVKVKTKRKKGKSQQEILLGLAELLLKG